MFYLEHNDMVAGSIGAKLLRQIRVHNLVKHINLRKKFQSRAQSPIFARDWKPCFGDENATGKKMQMFCG